MSSRSVLSLLGIAILLAGVWYVLLPDGNPFERSDRIANSALEEKNFALVEQLAAEFEAAGDLDRSRLLRGRSLLKQQRFSKAYDTLSRVPETSRWKIDAAILAAEAQIGMGRLPHAEFLLSIVLNEQPNRIDAHRHLAAIYYDQGDLMSALNHLEAQIILDPNDFRPLRLRGMIRRHLDRHAETVEDLTRALQLPMPDSVREDIHIELGEAYIKLFRYEDAAQAVSDIQTDQASAIRAEWRLARKEFREAHEEIDRQLAVNPSHPGLLQIKGKVYLAQEDPTSAIDCFRKAVQEAPNDYPTQYQLSVAFSRAGRLNEAEAQLRKADRLRDRLKEIVDLSDEAMRDAWAVECREKLSKIWTEMGKPDLAAMWSKAAMAAKSARRGS